jgi:hypothetical protein
MQQPIAATLSPTKSCSICGKAVSLESCKTDKQANIVREVCYAAHMRPKNAQRKAQHIPHKQRS